MHTVLGQPVTKCTLAILVGQFNSTSLWTLHRRGRNVIRGELQEKGGGEVKWIPFSRSSAIISRSLTALSLSLQGCQIVGGGGGRGGDGEGHQAWRRSSLNNSKKKNPPNTGFISTFVSKNEGLKQNNKKKNKTIWLLRESSGSAASRALAREDVLAEKKRDVKLDKRKGGRGGNEGCS